MSHLDARTLDALEKRAPLVIDPTRSIAVKRNVHEIVLDVPAGRFAQAFHEVMAERDAAFGPIEVRRDPSRNGEPFVVGERFHGCFAVGATYPRLAAFLRKMGLAKWMARFENALLSDYTEITRIVEDGRRFHATYVYLSGSPIAGESSFEVEPLGADRARLTAVFHYQEIGVVAVLVLQQMAAKLHDRVLVEQIRRAAERAGGRVLFSTMEPSSVPPLARSSDECGPEAGSLSSRSPAH